MRQKIRPKKLWFWLAGGCLLISMLTAIADSFQPWAQDRPTYASLLWIHLQIWSPWCLATYAAISLTWRFPPLRPRLMLALGVQIGAAALWSQIYAGWLYVLSFPGSGLAQPGVTPDFGNLSRQYALFAAMIYALAVLFCYIAYFFKRMRQREAEAASLGLRNAELETQLAQNQLLILRSQLRPHFLFNTLNAIAGLVRKNQNQQAMTMLDNLSGLLRQTLKTEGTNMVRLQEELAFSQRYLDIEKVRMGPRLKIELCVTPGLEHWPVPCLLLQPLLENAMRHGIAECLAEARLTMKISAENNLLHISIFNDGPPLKQPPEHPGIGIANTRARLEKLYGGKARFDLYSVPDGGVEVQIWLPAECLFHEEEPIAHPDPHR